METASFSNNQNITITHETKDESGVGYLTGAINFERDPEMEKSFKKAWEKVFRVHGKMLEKLKD